MVYKDAGELAAHCLSQQCGGNRGIHSAGQTQQDFSIAHFLSDGLDGLLAVVSHGPIAGGAAHFIEEIADHIHTMLGMVHFRMELHAVEPTLLIGDGHVGAGVRVRHELEPIGHLSHVIAVAHPGDALGRQTLEQLAGSLIKRLGLAVLSGAVRLGSGDFAAQSVRHELTAVADAQDGHAQLEDGGVVVGCFCVVDAVGAAGEDEADGVHGFQFFQGGRIGLDFTIYIALTDTAGDQLVILSAEIQYNDQFMLHAFHPFLSF